MLKRLRRTPLGRKAQTIVEYTVIVIIILGALIALKDYIKRGVQGRWKSATDDMGDQYDPQAVNSNIVYGTLVNAQTTITVENGTDDSGGPTINGLWTNRLDQSNSVETKSGFTQVGS
jgi:Flp pilus assembly pilin Flp